MLFDVVIPLGPNDESIFQTMIKHTKKNIIAYRNIYVVTTNSMNLVEDGFTIIKEEIFPFNKKTIIEYLGNNERNGWYLQQLIKLYAGCVIPDILPHYLVIDADTIFLKPTRFIDEKGLPMYSYGVEHHPPYFQHMTKLHPTFIKQNNTSGICHHMMFNVRFLNEIFNIVKKYHKTMEPFYITFLKNVDREHFLGAGASEYELYYNYIHVYHKNDFSIRPLQWLNVTSIEKTPDIDYISYHWYARK